MPDKSPDPEEPPPQLPQDLAPAPTPDRPPGPRPLGPGPPARWKLFAVVYFPEALRRTNVLPSLVLTTIGGASGLLSATAGRVRGGRGVREPRHAEGGTAGCGGVAEMPEVRAAPQVSGTWWSWKNFEAFKYPFNSKRCRNYLPV